MSRTKAHEEVCEFCGGGTVIDGDYPRYDCYCIECGETQTNFDMLKYAQDYISEYTCYIYDTRGEN